MLLNLKPLIQLYSYTAIQPQREAYMSPSSLEIVNTFCYALTAVFSFGALLTTLKSAQLQKKATLEAGKYMQVSSSEIHAAMEQLASTAGTCMQLLGVIPSSSALPEELQGQAQDAIIMLDMRLQSLGYTMHWFPDTKKLLEVRCSYQLARDYNFHNPTAENARALVASKKELDELVRLVVDFEKMVKLYLVDFAKRIRP